MKTMRQQVKDQCDQLELIFGGPKAIEAQEARGQQEFVANEILPIKGGARQILEQAGVVFGQPVDQLFVEARLPAGWKKVPTNHSMWSNLLDDRQRVRARIFYKAAYYDRDAKLHIQTRYQIIQFVSCSARGKPDDLDKQASNPPRFATVVVDGRQVIEVIYQAKKDEYSQRQGMDDAYTKAKAWLTDRFPKWEDPAAYWDEEAKPSGG